VDDDEVRAVFVCIPNWAHHEAAVTALELRRHVLCEKPLGRTADEALSLLRAAERAGVAHMVNFTYRFRPETAAARRLIRAGILGKVYHAHGTLSQGRWFSPDGRPSDERGDATAWRFGPDGSVVLDLASHLVDMCALLGDIDWVQAWATTFQVDAPPAEDASGFSLGFANGPVAHLLTSRWATGHKEHLSLEIAGSHGAIAFDRAGVRLWTRHDPVWRAVPTPAVRTFLESFHAAISGHDADVPSFRDGAWNNLVLDAIVRSARSGVVVALSPSRLNSLDPRANQYLTPRA